MRIKLTGLTEVNFIGVCKLIREKSSLNLMEAKRTCEALLDGQSQVIVIDSEEQGAELSDSLRNLQVTVQVDDEGH